MKKKSVALKYLSVFLLFAGVAFLGYSAMQFIQSEIQAGTSSLSVGLRHAISRPNPHHHPRVHLVHHGEEDDQPEEMEEMVRRRTRIVLQVVWIASILSHQPHVNYKFFNNSETG